MQISVVKRVVQAVLIAGLFVGTASPKPVHRGRAHTVTGTAVYYNDSMNGRTVSLKGDKYDRTALTAATHSGFALGSSVKITNLRNRKSITVKVNDRMNPRSKAVVDVSRRVAEELGMIPSGHAQVRVQAI